MKADINQLNDKIKSLTDRGVNVDDILLALMASLDGVEKTCQEAEAKGQRDARTAKVNEIEKAFWEDIDTGHLDWEDVGYLAALVAEEDHPEWTAAHIDEFMKGIQETGKNLANLVGKSPAEVMKKLSEELMEDLKNLTPSRPGFSFAPSREGWKPPVNPRITTSATGDADKIQAFLDSLRP